MVAQLVASRLDVAAPVALFQNVILVVVQSGRLLRDLAQLLAEERHDAQHPYRRHDAQHPLHAHLLLQQVAELGRAVYVAVGEEILSAAHAAVESEEHRLHHVEHVDERDVLALESRSEVDVLLYALSHEEVVLLARSVDAGGAQYDVGEVVADAVEVLLGVELALAVRRVGVRHVVLADVLVGLLLVYGAEDAERTEEHEALQRHLQLDERIDEVLCALGIHAAEVGLVETFSHASGMNDVVELVLAELCLQLLLRTEVKLNKMYALVLKIFARCGFSHCCPHLHISVEGFLNDKTANEATGSCYKYLVSHS